MKKMGQFYYNRLRNNRIKAMTLGLSVMVINVAVIYSYYVMAGKNMNVFYVVAISIGAMGLLYVMALISFGQVIEKSDGQITTYYKLGKQKLRSRTLGRLAHSNLEQDANKYYCLTIKTSDGHILILEKYATLNEANQGLDELRTQVG